MFTVRMLNKDGKVDFYCPERFETYTTEFNLKVNGKEVIRKFSTLDKLTVHMGSGREEVLLENGQLLHKTK